MVILKIQRSKTVHCRIGMVSGKLSIRIWHDGTFDQVFEYKAKTNPDMTAEEYREYYEIGYKTDVEKN